MPMMDIDFLANLNIMVYTVCFSIWLIGLAISIIGDGAKVAKGVLLIALATILFALKGYFV